MIENVQPNLEYQGGGANWPKNACEVNLDIGSVGVVKISGDVIEDVCLNEWVKGDLLSNLWSFENTGHWVATRNPETKIFQSIKVWSFGHAKELIEDFMGRGYDAYYSVAEFDTEAQTRKGREVKAVRAFWLDIDVGADKAAKGQGYATLKDAKVAEREFRKIAGLPGPTHVVMSGGGLHYYWVVNKPISPAQWLASAKQLKELTKSLGLFADPTRTADIASLMRVPGTRNFKNPVKPRAVELIYANETLIEVSEVLGAIEAAHAANCRAVVPHAVPAVEMRASQGSNVSVLPKQRAMLPAELSKLTSALCVLSPDVEESVWSLQRIAPIARAARENPMLAVDLCMLARNWSSGALRGMPSKAWTTPGSNGLTGEQYFDVLWERFLTDNYIGGRTLGSIYFDAQATGWTA